MPRTETRERGLYKNGNRWWLRVRGPQSGAVKPRSTGTDNLKIANAIARMVRELVENRPSWDLLELVVSGELELEELYNHRAAGTITELRAKLKARDAAADDPDIEPWVAKWELEHLGPMVRNGKLSPKTAHDYVYEVRALMPEGVPFLRSQFTEDVLKARLDALVEPRSKQPLSSSTRRRYVSAWQLFYKYARKRVPLTQNPFDDEDWIPENNSSRMKHWDHDTRLRVVNAMHGQHRIAAALILGTGIELGALLALTGADVGGKDDRTIVAHGTKNRHREDRTIFVDRWAWEIFYPHARYVLPTAPVFTELGFGGAAFRAAFYEAQVALGLIKRPPTSESGKRLWRTVDPHTIHDARHTYWVCRILGLDGEPRQSLKFLAHQLGHGSEQMGMMIYGKTNIAERLRLIELAEARRSGQRDAEKAGVRGE